MRSSNNTFRFHRVLASAALLLFASASLVFGQRLPPASAGEWNTPERGHGRQTFRIAGRVSDERGRPVAGVRVTLGGARTARAYTGRDGEYRFANLSGGQTYRVRLSKSDYLFLPPSLVFRDLGGDEFPEHTATQASASIGGRVTDERGRPVRDATLTLTGTRSQTARTDGEGLYLFEGLRAGEHYRVTVSKSGYRFAEPSRVFEDLEGRRAADFEGERFYTVWGRATVGGRGARDVTVRLTGRGFRQTARTDGAGYFNFTDVPAGAAYTLAASGPGVVFTPSRQTVSVNSDTRVANFLGARESATKEDWTSRPGRKS